MNLTYIIIAAVVALFLYSLYVSIIQKRNKVLESLSSIDVQLKKRHDLIPNILTIAKKFMEHETEVFEGITKLRTAVKNLESRTDAEGVKEKFALESELQAQMGKLMISVENYPALKSDQTMLQAMQTYNEVEEHIAAARRFYNASVNELKNAVEIFPGSVVAAMLNIKSMPFFEMAEAEKAPVNAADIL